MADQGDVVPRVSRAVHQASTAAVHRLQERLLPLPERHPQQWGELWCLCVRAGTVLEFRFLTLNILPVEGQKELSSYILYMLIATAGIQQSMYSN